MRQTRILAGAVLLVAGCVHGTQLKEFRPAHTPEGASVNFRLPSERYPRKAELFAVDSTGLLLMSTELIHVRFDKLRVVDFVQFNAPYDVFDGGFGTEQRALYARVSRFPQGLDGPLLARVLAALGQDAVREVP